MGKVLMEVHDLKTYYKTRFGEKVHAVDGVSLTLDEGQSIGIAGESGCGKSTLAMSLMCYYYPPLNYESGSIIVNGNEISRADPDKLRSSIYGSEIAYIPQAAMNALNPTQKIINFIEDVMKVHKPQMSRTEVRNMAEERFKTLNLPVEVLNQFAVELSGGMKQRTVIGISTILNPKVLIADEPSSALDVTSQKIVIKLLKDLMKKGFIKSLIFITHELPLLYNVTENIMVMYAGEIVEYGTADEVIMNPLHPYSKGLMNSIIVPEKGTRGKKLSAIPGAPPNLKHIPEGCRFADRCKYAKDECRHGRNDMKEIDGRMFRCMLDVNKLKEMYKGE